jgi:hypothetical protein
LGTLQAFTANAYAQQVEASTVHTIEESIPYAAPIKLFKACLQVTMRR